MKLFRWVDGRQESHYKKLPLILSKTFNIDCYLIKFLKGSYIPKHRDLVDEGKHYRLNIILFKAKVGGEFKCEQTIFNFMNRVILFRPDKNEHSVSTIEEGQRWVFSLGWKKL